MPGRVKRIGAGVVLTAVVFLAPFIFQAPAGAGPGAYHTVVGSGAEYEPGLCADALLCPATYGDAFSIDASDKAGAYGWMRLSEVNIPLTCVTITHGGSGHTVYASGTGTDGRPYFATVSVPIVTGSFIIGNHPGSRPCGGEGWWSTSGYGTFGISAHP